MSGCGDAAETLCFAGIGPFYPHTPNDAVGSDATYESSSEPGSFTAIPPTAGQTFTVGVNSDADATYGYVPDIHGNQGRSYGIGVYYTSSSAVPELSAWAMLLVGFAGLGFSGFRASRQGGSVRVLAIDPAA
jgi:hypothetical protein